jgi:vesicle-associated membrane protein 2
MSNKQYNKLDDTKQQVNTVIDIMKDNMEKVLQRDEKLTDIEDKADDLQDKSQRFQKLSTKLKQQMLCKNIKFMVAIGIVVLFLLLIILLIIYKN